MNKHFVFILLLLMVCLSIQAQSNSYSIIPQPQKVVVPEGEFELDEGVTLSFDRQSQELESIVNNFISSLSTQYNIDLRIKKGGKSSKNLSLKHNSSLKEEAYVLNVGKDGIYIEYKNPVGVFYATQTLRQISQMRKSKIYFPAIQAEDYPKMEYRGYLLDVARHVMPIDHLKKTIDALSYYKINVFHLHLTDDQGWRIEIKKYPRLHEIGAWRNETQNGHRVDKPITFDRVRHGGYYTQEELKDLVAYAQSRYVRLIPEVDIPGHAQSILAAYPEYGCVNDTTYQVSTIWGIHDNILCPKEETFAFLNDVFDEVLSIFPDRLIHIGGDEVVIRRWIESSYCQDLIKKLGLKNEDKLQSYFIGRVEKHLNAEGRDIVGWDEILEGGIAPGATIMSWRGERAGIEAARKKHPVVMAPSSHLYFNFYNTTKKKELEPLCNTNALPLKKVYDYSPYPKQLSVEEQSYIVGIQGCLWGEYCKTPEQADALTFPRICAVAETAWTGGEKDYDDFYERLKLNIQDLEHLGIKYSKLFLDPENNLY